MGGGMRAAGVRGWGGGVVRDTVFVCMHVFVCRLSLITCFCV